MFDPGFRLGRFFCGDCFLEQAIARDVFRLEFGVIWCCDGKSDLGVMASAKGCLDGSSCMAGNGQTHLLRGHDLVECWHKADQCN